MSLIINYPVNYISFVVLVVADELFLVRFPEIPIPSNSLLNVSCEVKGINPEPTVSQFYWAIGMKNTSNRDCLPLMSIINLSIMIYIDETGSKFEQPLTMFAASLDKCYHRVCELI